MSQHAVIIRGFRKDVYAGDVKTMGVTVRQEVECACGAMIAGDAPEGWFDRCKALLQTAPTANVGVDWTPEWSAERETFKAQHRDPVVQAP